jgi:hypothetical protein
MILTKFDIDVNITKWSFIDFHRAYRIKSLTLPYIPKFPFCYSPRIPAYLHQPLNIFRMSPALCYYFLPLPHLPSMILVKPVHRIDYKSKHFSSLPFETPCVIINDLFQASLCVISPIIIPPKLVLIKSLGAVADFQRQFPIVDYL